MTHYNDTTGKDETPLHDQAHGVSGEQLSFLPKPIFCPILPPPHSAAAVALSDLMERDLTQPDWLQEGKGWRLAAAVKELGYLGWEPVSVRVMCNQWSRKIARYSLTEKAKQAAFTLRQQGGVNA
ncbi:MAG: hypothetical protein V4731_05755 [Pseudomonadota bacterium]